jgi:hypothetical protein
MEGGLLPPPTLFDPRCPHQVPDTLPPHAADSHNPVIASIGSYTLNPLAFDQAPQAGLRLRTSSLMQFWGIEVGQPDFRPLGV